MRQLIRIRELKNHHNSHPIAERGKREISYKSIVSSRVSCDKNKTPIMIIIRLRLSLLSSLTASSSHSSWLAEHRSSERRPIVIVLCPNLFEGKAHSNKLHVTRTRLTPSESKTVVCLRTRKERGRGRGCDGEIQEEEEKNEYFTSGTTKYNTFVCQ